MSTLEVNTINPQSGTTVTIGGSGDTVTLGSGATQSGVGGVMTPYFEVNLSSHQTGMSNATYTKIQYTEKLCDSENYYDNTTNYRFTPLVAGKYYVYASLDAFGGASSSLIALNQAIYKNGTKHRVASFGFTSNYGYTATIFVSAIIDLNGSTDYLEVFGYIDSTNSSRRFQGTTDSRKTRFGAYRIIE